MLIFQNGAQDLRIKMEAEYSSQPPTTNLSTPTSLVSFIDKNSDSGLPGGLAASIAPADMLNVWNATKLNSKGGTVNTADGKRTSSSLNGLDKYLLVSLSEINCLSSQYNII